MKQSGLNRMGSNRQEETAYRALLGRVMDVPRGKEMARLAAQCHARAAIFTTASPPKTEKGLVLFRTAQTKHKRARHRWLAPRLVALLGEALDTLDARRFEDFSKIIRAVKESNETAQPAHPLHAKARAFADCLRLENELPHNAVLPVTQSEFIKLLGIPPKEHDESSTERKALKLIGLRFTPDKRGRKRVTVIRKI